MLTNKKRLVKLAFPLLPLITLVSLGGILMDDLYSREVHSWKVQAIAQDYVDLLVLVPVLLVSFILLQRGSRVAIFVWLGGLIYTVYTYTIYSFAVHFNLFFLLYCWILGLAVYSIIALVASLGPGAAGRWHSGGKTGMIASGYMIVVSITFYAMWLVEIVPVAVGGGVPASVKDVGAFVNPVHALDLSLLLPGMFGAAVLYLKRNAWGQLFAPAILMFTILMNITIGMIVVFQYQWGLAPGLAMAWVFFVLAAVNAALFTRWVKNI